MNILISGASGLLGKQLTDHFTKSGHNVIPLSRNKSGQKPPLWDLAQKSIDLGDETIDVVIHLAGENISSGRWTEERKRRIKESRVFGTTLLAGALASLDVKPKTMITASAVGFYGNRKDKIMDESADQGEGFLASVCREWEGATAAANEAGIRVVNTRFGMILSPRGGALQKMLPPFKMGLGGKIGNGKQYMSWVDIDDVANIMEFIILNESISGPVNTVSPNPVTNSEFTRILSRALHRPAVLPLPTLMARLIFGEMADELLLSSTRASPKKLLDHGYTFKSPDLNALFNSWF